MNGSILLGFSQNNLFLCYTIIENSLAMYSVQKIKTQVPIDYKKVTQFCQRWDITEFALFGSVLRDDFKTDKSDIDVLISFSKNAHWTLFDLVDMEDELQKIFGRKVDLVERRGIEQSRNYLRRKAILESAIVIYATA